METTSPHALELPGDFFSGLFQPVTTRLHTGYVTVQNAATSAKEYIADKVTLVRTTDYFALAKKISDKIRRPVEKFQQTVLEANYNAQPRTLWSLISGEKRDLPDTTPLAVGNRMIDTSQTVGKRFLWAAAFAALSTKTLMMAAIVLGVTGGAMFALEYYRARRDSEDIITEVNFAGQKVEGKRADLCRLYQAQMKIMNLGSSFKQASLESTSDTIQKILEQVAGERKRVRILDAGPYGAYKDAYDFSRPQVALVDHDGGERNRISRNPPPRLIHDIKPLRQSFARKHARADEIVEKLDALHKSLPVHLRRRVLRELQNN